ncbi:scarecrow-like protein 34 [Panicum virgatum]|uniref:scarecrow-like protein 34 n=1 Tax=Panicum virgatum TaxID=38727 RepID=UPI0019D66F1A|nr:scarecrow-like protein 34 [Panicum virgatum]
MAATPEGLFADPEPFSPSVFLDLPPTPRPDGNGEGPASSDDLVLPFISRLLMEVNMDDNFLYQFPDHPALLQAQEPYARILSDSNSSASGSAATLSPSSDHDPVQLLMSPLRPDMGLHDFTGDDVGAFFLPAQDGASPELEQNRVQSGTAGDANAFVAGRFGGGTGVQSSALLDIADEQSPAQLGSTTLPSPAGDGVLASAFFSSQNGGDMDVLHTAFLKGMEEANKFLPTINNNLLIDQEGGRGDGSRGRKNRLNWDDDLEAETCRKSKLMVPEPEETGDKVDEMIVNGRELCLKEMEALRITMGSDARKNTRKGKGKSAKGRWSADEAVDLSTVLIHCAQAVATDNRRSATELLRQIKQRSSPRGDATQRLAHCFADGLEARLAGSGSQVYRSLMAERISVMDYLKAYQVYLAASCFKMMAFKFSNMTISKVIAGRKKVHIVDYGIQYGFQWPSLLGYMATLKGGPPQVRITGIDLPHPGFRPASRIEETGRRLSNCASQLGVPFKFHSMVKARWETIGVDDLNIDPDEVLIVNSIRNFGNLMDEGVDIDSPSPRDVVLSNIRKMKPDAFILFVMNASYNAPFFVTRFREALFFHSAMFDMLDATAPRDNHQRFLVERGLFRKCALNVVACEGLDRVERAETYKQWQVRNHRAGLRQLPLDPDVVKDVREKVREHYHKDFVIDVDHQWLLEGWKGRILYAMSTWVADDAISEL